MPSDVPHGPDKNRRRFSSQPRLSLPTNLFVNENDNTAAGVSQVPTSLGSSLDQPSVADQCSFQSAMSATALSCCKTSCLQVAGSNGNVPQSQQLSVRPQSIRMYDIRVSTRDPRTAHSHSNLLVAVAGGERSAVALRLRLSLDGNDHALLAREFLRECPFCGRQTSPSAYSQKPTATCPVDIPLVRMCGAACRLCSSEKTARWASALNKHCGRNDDEISHSLLHCTSLNSTSFYIVYLAGAPPPGIG